MSDFQKLQEELDALAELRKATPHIEPDGDEPEDEDENEEDEDEDEYMGKSFGVTLENGEQAQAFDGTALIKSLQDDMTNMQEQLLKAQLDTVDLMKGLATDINELKGQIATIQGQGRGRKSTISIAEKPETGSLAKASNDMSASEFLLKAENAMQTGKINALDMAKIEGFLNSGQQVPPHLISRVVS